MLLVDGYNLLLAVCERERVPEHELDLVGGRARLEGLLAEWAELRGREVVLVWDGRRVPRPWASASRRITVAWAEPPTEADDRIVALAAQYVQERREVRVVSRDRGLLRRLPDSAMPDRIEALIDDLDALVADPLGAPFLGRRTGDDPLVPASAEPVDTSRLPRRRALPAVVGSRPERAAPRPGTPSQSTSPPVSQAPREESTQARKERGRARYERARARRKKR